MSNQKSHSRSTYWLYQVFSGDQFISILLVSANLNLIARVGNCFLHGTSTSVQSVRTRSLVNFCIVSILNLYSYIVNRYTEHDFFDLRYQCSGTTFIYSITFLSQFKIAIF